MLRYGLVLLAFMLTTQPSWADLFPKGCEPRDYQFYHGNLVLNETGEQRLFVLLNHAGTLVDIERHRTEDEFMAPSFSVSLAAGNWAAFASDLQHLIFECRVTANDEKRRVDCAQFLDVCEYPRAKFALSNHGNYWVSANKPQRDVINDAAGKGIYLHW